MNQLPVYRAVRSCPLRNGLSLPEICAFPGLAHPSSSHLPLHLPARLYHGALSGLLSQQGMSRSPSVRQSLSLGTRGPCRARCRLFSTSALAVGFRVAPALHSGLWPWAWLYPVEIGTGFCPSACPQLTLQHAWLFPTAGRDSSVLECPSPGDASVRCPHPHAHRLPPVAAGLLVTEDSPPGFSYFPALHIIPPFLRTTRTDREPQSCFSPVRCESDSPLQIWRGE